MTMAGVTSVAMPAEAARLTASFDPSRLLADLDTVRTHQWSLQRIYGDGVGEQTQVDWRILPLRSPGGDASRTDPGGPGVEEFADTSWLDRVPYIRSVLDSVPAPLRSVRLMALGPGAVSDVHNDTKYGLAWGVVRLHVPIVTNPDAVLVLDGVTHWWRPGEFWFGAFSRMHKVQNSGTETRVHIVVDCLVVPELAALFPETWRTYFEHGEVLFNRSETPLARASRERLACSFELPVSFADWEEEDGLFLQPQPNYLATVVETEAGAELRVGHNHRFKLVHVAEHEFRFAGWSQERTVHLLLDDTRPVAILRTRIGRQIRQLTIPAKPAVV